MILMRSDAARKKIGVILRSTHAATENTEVISIKAQMLLVVNWVVNEKQ